ncbi:MAG TPA: hypothetical protein VN607_03035 [Gemmatimonadaceae bacterium]|nr:hypothetical protein [Gemmatimonadaceae bacterium]
MPKFREDEAPETKQATESPAPVAVDEVIIEKLMHLLETTDVHIGAGGARPAHRLILPLGGDFRVRLLEVLDRALEAHR